MLPARQGFVSFRKLGRRKESRRVPVSVVRRHLLLHYTVLVEQRKVLRESSVACRIFVARVRGGGGRGEGAGRDKLLVLDDDLRDAGASAIHPLRRPKRAVPLAPAPLRDDEGEEPNAP